MPKPGSVCSFFFFLAFGHTGSQSLNPWIAREVHICPLHEKRCRLLSEQLKVRMIFLSILITFLAHLFFVWTQIESSQAGDGKSERRHFRNQRTKMDGLE